MGLVVLGTGEDTQPCAGTDPSKPPPWRGGRADPAPPQGALGGAKALVPSTPQPAWGTPTEPGGLRPRTTHGFTRNLQLGECSVPVRAILDQSQHAPTQARCASLHPRWPHPSRVRAAQPQRVGAVRDGGCGEVWVSCGVASPRPRPSSEPQPRGSGRRSQGLACWGGRRAAVIMREEENKVPDFATSL